MKPIASAFIYQCKCLKKHVVLKDQIIYPGTLVCSCGSLLVLEMPIKVDKWHIGIDSPVEPNTETVERELDYVRPQDFSDDALDILTSQGYNKKEAKELIRLAQRNNPKTLEEMVLFSLQEAT